MLDHRLATPVIQPRAYFHKDGKSLIGGKVYSFKVGEDVFKPTYRNSEFTALNQNPIVLDQAGSALIYVQGSVLLKVYDKSGVLVEERIIYQQQNIAQFFDKYGKPLAFGKVTTCDYQSTLKKTSYKVDDIANPNPVLLDETGCASIEMVGAYRLRSYSNTGVFIADQDFKRPPAKVLTSRVYPAYFYDSVAASASLIIGDQIPLNIGRFSDSAVASASIEAASIWSVFNIGYMPIDATSASASIEGASIWSVLNIGYMPIDAASASASILSASIQNAVIKHTEKPENISSSAQLLGAQIENQELNPAPRNINYVVDGDVDFAFEADGIGYTYSYYRSLTPMNIASLPAPIVTGLTTKAYTDTSAPSSDFYVRFSANKASSEFVSEEKVVILGDPLDSYVVSLLRFENDFTDEKGNIWTARNASTYIDAGVLHVDATDGGLLCTNTNFLDFGAGAFCFEAFVELNATSLSPAILRNNYNPWQANGAVLSVSSQRMRYVFYGPAEIISTQTMTTGEWHHLAWARDASGMLRMFLNGVMLRADSYPTTVNFSYWGATLFQSGLIKSKGVRITKGHARYTANFVPPARF